MSKRLDSHETLRRPQTVKEATDRSFGLIFAGLFAAVGAVSWWAGRAGWSYWFGASVLFFSFGLIFPPILRPFKRVWIGLGNQLHKVVNPLIMGIIFFLVITPTGGLMRLLRRRPLDLSFEPSSASYWKRREHKGPPPETMKNQF